MQIFRRIRHRYYRETTGIKRNGGALTSGIRYLHKRSWFNRGVSTDIFIDSLEDISGKQFGFQFRSRRSLARQMDRNISGFARSYRIVFSSKFNKYSFLEFPSFHIFFSLLNFLHFFAPNSPIRANFNSSVRIYGSEIGPERVDHSRRNALNAVYVI